MKKMLMVAGALLLAGIANAGGGAHWGYTGHEGPAHWGELAAEYEMCGKGKNQSPIDIIGAMEADLGPIDFDYSQVELAVLNNGHTIQANYASGSGITVDGHTYKLVQFHFHSPSENMIAGKSFPLEAHLVHADEAGNLAVIGLMFEEGAANPSIEKVWARMPHEAGVTNAVAGETIDAMEMLPESKDYYWFNGSLTTPPCSEGVRWMVLKEPVSVSGAQVEKFQHLMHHDNNRPVQPLNARKILK